MDRLQAIEDRIEIQELMNRYARMVDERAWHEMDRVFAPGATIDYRSTGGVAGPYEETLGWLGRALEPWPINLHFITNLTISLDADHAQSRCYFHAPMGRAGDGGEQLVITNAGYYDDELVRTSEGWRISARHCEQTIMIGSLPSGYEIPG